VALAIDLSGRVAIVTGGGRGVGRGITERLLEAGAEVVICGRKEPESLPAGGGRRALFTPADVRELEQIEAVGAFTEERFGRIDVLVNNAGVAPGGPVETLSEEAWDLNLDVNLKGTFLMCQAVVPVMKRQRSGRIINAASFAAILPITGSAAYAASKAGVHYFTRVLAGELGPWNITVNCYAPGMIPTEINRFREQPPERQRRLLDTLTFRRWGEARDVANLVCFLASDLAGYITGTLIDVSGGKLATQIPRLAWEAAAAEGVVPLD
jgi:3-oxoacyl-[acyl-carrier protein] reductase